MSGYDDIINLPHHTSPDRPRMSALDRAAQFSPFSALTGYDDAVKETARFTDSRVELDEYEKLALNVKLQIIKEHLDATLSVKITYFRPDARKDGGEYVTVCGEVKKIDEYRRELIMQDKQHIPIDDVTEIEI